MRKASLFLAGMLLATSAVAQSTLQCPRGLVSVGDSEESVLESCGAPTSRQTWDQVRVEEIENPDGSFAEPAVAIPQDEWVYDWGPTRFVVAVRFDRGIVRAISTGGYGLSQPFSNGPET